MCVGVNEEQLVEMLSLVYQSENRLSLIETEDGVRYTSVLLDQMNSDEVSDSVERICGEDGAGTKIAIDIYYTEDDTVSRVCLRRGYTRSLVGTIDRVVN
jgi:hypothetical protein